MGRQSVVLMWMKRRTDDTEDTVNFTVSSTENETGQGESPGPFR